MLPKVFFSEKHSRELLIDLMSCGSLNSCKVMRSAPSGHDIT